MDLNKIVREKRDKILEQAARHGARNVRIFGSVARNEARDTSDVDFLVDMESGRTLLDLIGLNLDLKKLLRCEVDVVTENGVSPFLRKRILRAAVPL